MALSMPKRLIKRYVPDPQYFKDHKYLRFLGHRLHATNLWHINRRSAARACAVGLFIAFLPAPGQMVIAAVAALFLEAYLPLSVALVWLTNPLTMPPIFYATYRFGAWLLDDPVVGSEALFSPAHFMTALGVVWPALLLGSVLAGTAAAAAGYCTVQLAWRGLIRRQWNARRVRRTNFGS